MRQSRPPGQSQNYCPAGLYGVDCPATGNLQHANFVDVDGLTAAPTPVSQSHSAAPALLVLRSWSTASSCMQTAVARHQATHCVTAPPAPCRRLPP
jgi:hypothetical protein